MKELTEKEKETVNDALAHGKPLGMTGIVFNGSLQKFTKGDTKETVVRGIIDKIPAAPAVTADMPSQEVASSVANTTQTETTNTTPPKEKGGTTGVEDSN